MKPTKRKSTQSTQVKSTIFKPSPGKPPPTDNSQGIATGGPQFAETQATADPLHFTVAHTSDKQAYSILDSQKGKLLPRPFPVVKGMAEPVITLASALGDTGNKIVAQIEDAGQIVFHSVGDTGSTRGPESQSEVADKMVSDYRDTDPRTIPSFLYHLGDVVYSFGEAEYYYDQFYDPYRDYPAPIFAIPGNHDGMVSPLSSTPALQAFLQNFCTSGQPSHRTPEAGGLPRTAQTQPGVYFTLEAPFVRILGLYSNCLEDPGIISDQGNHNYSFLGQTQVEYLRAALTRIRSESFEGAVIIAVHHPPYVAQLQLDSADSKPAGKHSGSPLMLKDIDSVCEDTGVWPHAVISGHAHNSQRFTRAKDGRETPFVICGNGGHAVTRLTHKGTPAIRTPVVQPTLSDGSDTVTFENYDDQDYGYLRIIADPNQLRIEYHPASDGAISKTPDDFVTVDLKSYKLIHYQAQ